MLNVTRNPVEAAPFGRRRTRCDAGAGQAAGTSGPVSGPAGGSSLGPALARLRAALALAILAVLAAVGLAALTADPALAQQGGTGSEINNAITQFNQWLATIVVSLGGTALLFCVIVWLFSGSDSRRREGAVRWMGNIVVAIFVGLSVPAIIALIQGFAGGGSG